MSSINLKVCGMKDRDNILEVGLLRPDFMGFIFYKNSPRYVGGDFEIPSDLDSTVKRVGVFVNEAEGTIAELVSRHQLDFVQLHGDETPEQCKRLKNMGIGVVKVFAVDDEFDFSSVKPFESCVDYFLFDAKGKLRGGNNKTFDWKILGRYVGVVPFFLSGGLNPDNVDNMALIHNKMLFSIEI